MLFLGPVMRTRVYVDGFNLFYGALKGTPFKWVDPVRLATLLVRGHFLDLTALGRIELSDNDQEILRDAALPGSALEAQSLSIDARDLKARDSNLIAFERSAGAGALYYTAHLAVDLPVTQVSAISSGIEITRSYTRLGTESAEPIDSAAIGEAVQVRLRLVAPEAVCATS